MWMHRCLQTAYWPPPEAAGSPRPEPPTSSRSRPWGQLEATPPPPPDSSHSGPLHSPAQRWAHKCSKTSFHKGKMILLALLRCTYLRKLERKRTNGLFGTFESFGPIFIKAFPSFDIKNQKKIRNRIRVSTPQRENAFGKCRLTSSSRSPAFSRPSWMAAPRGRMFLM